MGLGKWLVLKMVRSNTRGMCRVLSLNFFLAKNEHEHDNIPHEKHISFFIIFAMQNRSGWQRIGDETFEHTKTGEYMKISKSETLLDIAKKVAEIEINYQISEQPLSDKQELLDESQKEVDRFFNK